MPPEVLLANLHKRMPRSKVVCLTLQAVGSVLLLGIALWPHPLTDAARAVLGFDAMAITGYVVIRLIVAVAWCMWVVLSRSSPTRRRILLQPAALAFFLVTVAHHHYWAGHLPIRLNSSFQPSL